MKYSTRSKANFFGRFVVPLLGLAGIACTYFASSKCGNILDIHDPSHVYLESTTTHASVGLFGYVDANNDQCVWYAEHRKYYPLFVVRDQTTTPLLIYLAQLGAAVLAPGLAVLAILLHVCCLMSNSQVYIVQVRLGSLLWLFSSVSILGSLLSLFLETSTVCFDDDQGSCQVQLGGYYEIASANCFLLAFVMTLSCRTKEKKMIIPMVMPINDIKEDQTSTDSSHNDVPFPDDFSFPDIEMNVTEEEVLVEEPPQVEEEPPRVEEEPQVEEEPLEEDGVDEAVLSLQFQIIQEMVQQERFRERNQDHLQSETVTPEESDVVAIANVVAGAESNVAVEEVV